MRARKHMKRFFNGQVRWMDGHDYQPWEHGLLEELTDEQILRCTQVAFWWISDLDFRREILAEEQIRVGVQRGELLEDADSFETPLEAAFEAQRDLADDAL